MFGICLPTHVDLDLVGLGVGLGVILTAASNPEEHCGHERLAMRALSSIRSVL